MNWTEGLLARHSRRRGRDKDAARQKEYFAKAQARKQEAASGKNQPRVPFVPDFLPRPPPASNNSSTSSIHRRKEKPPRKRLIQSQSDTNETANHPSGHLQLGSSLLGPAICINQDRLDIDVKRRKLLKENDWGGVQFQKPFEPLYPRQKTSFSHLTSRGNHHLPGNLQLHGLNSRLNERLSTPRSEHGMRIRIGHQDLRWSHDSNSVRSSDSRRGPLGDLESWYSPPPRLELSYSLSESCPSAYRLSESSGYFGADSTSQPAASDIATTIGRALEGRGGIVTSSPAVIYQPRPIRNECSFDIHSLEAQDNDHGSVIARAGSPPPSSSRLASDDSQWKAWLDKTPEPAPQSSSPVYQERGSFTHATRDWGGSMGQSQTDDPIYHRPARRDTWRESDERSPPLSPHPICLPSSSGLSDNTYAAVAGLESSGQAPFSKGGEERGWAAFIRGNGQSYDLNKSFPKPSSIATPGIHEDLQRTSNTQNLMELLVAKEGRQGKDHQHRETTQRTVPQDGDEDEIWKKFVFDDYTEISRRAREEIHEQTKCDLGLKRAIPPSHFSEPTSRTKDGQMQEMPTVTTEPCLISCPDLNWQIPESLSGVVEPAAAPNTGVDLPLSQLPNSTAESYLAPGLDLDTNILDLTSAYELDLSLCIPELSTGTVESVSVPNLDLSLQTAEASSGATEPPSASGDGQSSASIAHVTIEESAEMLSCTDKDMQAPSDAAAETNTADVNSTATQSGSPRPAHTEFKFHHPSLFIGRLASNGSAKVPCGPSTAVPKMGKRPRASGRRKQGRPDFRTMPDYDEDPIEEG